MEIYPIRNDDDHAAAIEKLWGAAPGTEEDDKLDILTTLVEKYRTVAGRISMSPIGSTC